jgi:restriction system protein
VFTKGGIVAKRGFFAEMQHQNQVAQRRREQALRQANRQHTAAVRAAEQAQRRAQQAHNQAVRASAAQQKEAQREAKRLHEESMTAQAASLTAQVAQTYDEIDSILSATLEVDDFVDLEVLRAVVQHPAFDRTDLERETPPPAPLVAPPEPVYVEPENTEKGLSGIFGGRKRHAELVAQAQAAFAQQHQAWQATIDALPAAQLKQMQDYQTAEQQRVAALGEARRAYEIEREKRETAADESNRQLDQLIAGLAAGAEDAVQEYVSIVLSRSVYPESFPVSHDFTFDSGGKELTLTVTVPTPTELPGVKEYKYVKSKDEIAETSLSQKDRRDRYATAVCQVALRTMHEVFEADRDQRIQTIALSVGVDHVHAATGRPKHVALVAVASDRVSFATFDLANVVPTATLQHLKALVSKNPYELVEIDISKGVRGT